MKCNNCNSYNARVYYSYDKLRHVLCPKCLKLLIEFDERYKETVDEQTSSGSYKVKSKLNN